ncbi:MAG: monomeric [FeFe] hydrogenase [Sphaerochaetaceae bacterium]
MLEINNQYTLMKRRIDTELLKLYFNGDLEKSIDYLPIDIIPRDRDASRCCLYKERAMVRYRIMALLGVDIEKEDDEYKSLKEFACNSLNKKIEVFPTLTTIKESCSGCPDEQFKITESCRGCFARPCLENCPKDAITFVNGKAQIVEELCIKCGKCLNVCPFHAVIHIPVPCEASCPVDAVHKNSEGVVEIDHEKCVDCGHCSRSCPFGAIVERSSLMHVAKMLKGEETVVAMIAPAIEGQFPGTLDQIISAIKKLNFSDVVEVAEGAYITANHEAQELKERKGSFMTTSCCPAYVSLVEKHIPFLKENVSTALSPMAYAALLCKERYKDAKIVFIGPCLAKKAEAAKLGTIDAVITFSELASLFIAKDIDVNKEEKTAPSDDKYYSECRDFAFSTGVGQSVMRYSEKIINIENIDGVDKKNYRVMKTWAKKAPQADLVEVMYCEGGCLAGPGVLVNPKIAMRLRNAATVEKVVTDDNREKKRA